MLSALLTIAFCSLARSDLNFLVGGDWGGKTEYPYVTDDELSTAKIMGEIAPAVDATMIWMMGDNFYQSGVTAVNDSRFKYTFEDVFNASSLQNIPFWMIAGNHDWQGDVYAQLQYSNYSSRWKFPSYYYTRSWDVPGTDYILQVVMIDTQLLCGCNSNDMESLYGCEILPSDDNGTIAEEQWEWINATLNASTADFLIVAGHFAIYSVANNGPCQCLINGLRGALIEYDVNFYVNGHDHTFELIIEDEHPDLFYITTGGAHVCSYSTAYEYKIPNDSLKFHGCQDGGFIRINVGNEGMYAEYYFGNSTDVVYTTETVTARTGVHKSQTTNVDADSVSVISVLKYLSSFNLVVLLFMLC